jgi:hypothetical protein
MTFHLQSTYHERSQTFSINPQVPIVTKDMKEQLTMPATDIRTTRKSLSASMSGAEASSSSTSKKRSRCVGLFDGRIVRSS